MSTKDKLGFITLGFIVWAAATSVYRVIGSSFFEGSATGYWLNVVFTGILYAVVSLGLMRWREIEQKDWLQGAICIALPGMLGEIPILAGFSELMSNMQPATAGRYAAFLFGGYSILIGTAWLMSANAMSQLFLKHDLQAQSKEEQSVATYLIELLGNKHRFLDARSAPILVEFMRHLNRSSTALPQPTLTDHRNQAHDSYRQPIQSYIA